jgi:hypothetical protein
MKTLIVGPRSLKDYETVEHALDTLTEVLGVDVSSVIPDPNADGVREDVVRWAHDNGVLVDPSTVGWDATARRHRAVDAIRKANGVIVVLDDRKDPNAEALLREARRWRYPTVYVWDIHAQRYEAVDVLT